MGMPPLKTGNVTTCFPHRSRGMAALRLARGILAIGVAGTLASCTVGPAYQRPAPPEARDYTTAPGTAIPAAPAAQGSVAVAQALEPGAAVDPHWWRGFGSPALDRLVARALDHNPDLAAAQATLEQAQYELKAAKGAFYPKVALGPGADRSASPAPPAAPRARSCTTSTPARSRWATTPTCSA